MSVCKSQKKISKKVFPTLETKLLASYISHKPCTLSVKWNLWICRARSSQTDPGSSQVQRWESGKDCLGWDPGEWSCCQLVWRLCLWVPYALVALIYSHWWIKQLYSNMCCVHFFFRGINRLIVYVSFSIPASLSALLGAGRPLLGMGWR